MPPVQDDNELPDLRQASDGLLRQLWYGLMQRLLTSPSMVPDEDSDKKQPDLDRMNDDDTDQALKTIPPRHGPCAMEEPAQETASPLVESPDQDTKPGTAIQTLSAHGNPLPIMPPISPGDKHTCEEPPDPQTILRALPARSYSLPGIFESFRDNVDFAVENLLDHVDPPRYYPLIGFAQLHHCHWKVTVWYTETINVSFPIQYSSVKRRTQVLYIDRDHLHSSVYRPEPQPVTDSAPVLPTEAEWKNASLEIRQKVAELTTKAVNLIQEDKLDEARSVYMEAGKLLPLSVQELVSQTLPGGPTSVYPKAPLPAVETGDRKIIWHGFKDVEIRRASPRPVAAANGNASARPLHTVVENINDANAVYAASHPSLSLKQIVEMTRQGWSDTIIINQINATGSTYLLTTEHIIWLRENGVSDYVISYMQSRSPHLLRPSNTYAAPSPAAPGVVCVNNEVTQELPPPTFTTPGSVGFRPIAASTKPDDDANAANDSFVPNRPANPVHRVFPGNRNGDEMAGQILPPPAEPEDDTPLPTKMNPEEERCMRFWHDYYAALASYYQSLERIDWVAFYKNHGTIINNGQGRIQFAPVFISPNVSSLTPGGPVAINPMVSSSPNYFPSTNVSNSSNPGNSSGPMAPIAGASYGLPWGGYGGYYPAPAPATTGLNSVGPFYPPSDLPSPPQACNPGVDTSPPSPAPPAFPPVHPASRAAPGDDKIEQHQKPPETFRHYETAPSTDKASLPASTAAPFDLPPPQIQANASISFDAHRAEFKRNLNNMVLNAEAAYWKLYQRTVIFPATKSCCATSIRS